MKSKSKRTEAVKAIEGWMHVHKGQLCTDCGIHNRKSDIENRSRILVRITPIPPKPRRKR